MATPLDATTGEAPAEDLAAKLDQLKASATQQYSLKNYIAAVEFYSEAAEVQDELNGEMSLENADLLYQYGRCLYHVAVSNSDVLGGKVAGTTQEPKRKKRKVAPAESTSKPSDVDGESSNGLIGGAISDGKQELAEDMVEAVVESKDGMNESEKQGEVSKPFFQITGDENWTDSEDEDGDAGEGEAEEEEDDFATSYEILDMARVLLARKLESAQENYDGKGKSKDENPEIRQIKERLADTHDLQAEISLENERFTDAIKDTRDGLNLKVEIYPKESSLVAEAHYKLSLALEFASVTSTTDEEGESKVAQVDDSMRAEAAAEMELAIASCRSRISKEEASLPNLDPAKSADLKKSIADVKDMVSDMEQRLVDLRNPAVSLSGLQPAGAPGLDDDPLRGVLGAMLGEAKGEQAKRIAEATEKATDLTGLVKHKKKPQAKAGGKEDVAVNANGKRKAEESVNATTSASTNGKKVKFEE